MDMDLLQKAVEKTDLVVLKRLKFIFKIIKALTAPPNSRNRQAHVYLLEVLDAIGDWSGKENAEITELLDKHLFPQICRLIATFSKEEFHVFQQFFAKYLLVKWEETFNFIVLEFLGDVYGFIASIAPFPVVEEYVEVFAQETMPPHIQLVILPSVIRNLPENTALDLSDSLSPIDNLRLSQREEISKLHLTLICHFWKSLIDSNTHSVQKLTPILHQCLLTSPYLDLLSETELTAIIQSLVEWSEGNTSSPDAFLLASSVFLPAVASSISPSLQDSIKVLIESVVITVKGCKNSSICVFVISVLQRVLEQAEEEFKEVMDKLMELYCIDKNSANGEDKNPDHVLQTIETFVKRILSESNANGEEQDEEENNRKRIKLMIDSLHQIC